MGKWLEFMDVRPRARADLQLFDFDLINMPCKAGHIVHGKWTMFTIPVKVTVLLELRLLAMLAEPSSTAVFRSRCIRDREGSVNFKTAWHTCITNEMLTLLFTLIYRINPSSWI